MRKIYPGSLIKLSLIAAVLGTMFITPVMAQDKGQDPQDQKMPVKPSDQTTTINGKVTTVTEVTVTVVDGAKNEHVITLGPNTKVTKGGKSATLADIKADDAVVVVATKDENEALTAVSITAV
jgi:hypothetical protein